MRSALLIWSALAPCLCWQPVSAEPACGCENHHGSLPALCGCPDDYCNKPMPSIHLLHCGGPDDYCRKPFPSILRIVHCGGCDDYRKKPWPNLCRPMDTSFYRCVGLSGCAHPPCEQPPQQTVQPVRTEPRKFPVTGE